jgi:hypothetical protein
MVIKRNATRPKRLFAKCSPSRESVKSKCWMTGVDGLCRATPCIPINDSAINYQT